MEDLPVRYGILGCANIARKMSRAILMTPGSCLLAIGSRSLEKAQNFAAANNFPPDTRIYGSYQSVLDDADVDVVYMPLPTSLHMEWVMKALDKKKHILLEKPPALSVEDVNAMILACEKQGLQIMDCTMWMHHPRTAKMKEVLGDKQSFGEILEVHSNFAVPMHAYGPAFFTENIRIKPELDSLGALGDLGWYSARAILWAVDYELPTEVTALPDAKFNKDGVLLSCKASCQWKDGKAATFQCSFLLNMTMNLTVHGSRATLQVDDFVIPYEEHKSQFRVQSLTMFEPLDLGWKPPFEVHHLEIDAPQESLMIKEFSSLVRGIKNGVRSTDLTWPTIARKTQQLLEAVKQSVENGCKTVTIG